MKKVFFVFAVATTLLYSCGGSSKTESQVDSTKTCCADSTKSDSSSVVVDSSKVDTSAH